jgi:hypothetical protein
MVTVEPTAPNAGNTFVICGTMVEMVSVKFCVAFGLTPFCAVNVTG